MTANTLPSGIGPLFQLAGSMGDGLEAHAPWLGALTPAVEFREILARLTTAEEAFAVARARKAAASARVQAADETLTAWLGKARLVVMLAKGNQWSEAWVEVGFTHRGTNVPKRVSARVALARRMVAFFARHAEYEVAFAEVTAARGEAIFAEMSAAQAELVAATQDGVRDKRTRDAAEKRLRSEMRTTVIFLGVLLSPGDERWLAFGLNRPRPDEAPRVRSRKSGSAAEVIALPPCEPGISTDVFRRDAAAA